LAQLADVEFTSGVSKVIHRDKYTAIKFTGYNAPGTATGDLLKALEEKMKDTKLPEGYQYKWAGTTEMQNEMMADLAFAGLLAIILTYMLLAAMLESFWQPVLILATLPLAFIGVFILMYYTDTNIGLTALMGMIMLIGIVVNNAILILDYVNQLIREEGYTAKDALLKAAPLKLKPILMSTIAIILGMLPMAMGVGDAGKEMRIPLGIVSIGGLVASTLLTLYVVPAFMYITSRNKKAA
jgi:HAE1 family hydrophobic/amphiphilic exporter-1